MIKLSPVLIFDTRIMTSPRSDETQSLLKNRVRREQTSVDDSEAQESSHPIGQLRLLGSLLVDSIPGSYILLVL